MNIVDKHQKGEGEGMRWIINIDKENLDSESISKSRDTDKTHKKYATNEFWCFRQRNGRYNREVGRW